MNVSDSELVARILRDSGYDPTAPAVDADTSAVLINTCAIRCGRARPRRRGQGGGGGARAAAPASPGCSGGAGSAMLPAAPPAPALGGGACSGPSAAAPEPCRLHRSLQGGCSSAHHRYPFLLLIPVLYVSYPILILILSLSRPILPYPIRLAREGAEARIWGKLAQLKEAKRQRRREHG